MCAAETIRLVAEQVAVDCAIDDARRVLTRKAVRRLAPVFHLAADTGEAAGHAVLGGPRQPSDLRSDEVVTGRPSRSGELLELPFQWTTRDYAVLFGSLSGHLKVRPGPTGVILCMEGTYAREPPAPDGTLRRVAERRAAEAAARALLGQLRSALEHHSPVPPRAGRTSAIAPGESGQAALGDARAVPPT